MQRRAAKLGGVDVEFLGGEFKLCYWVMFPHCIDF